jgi:AraC-like DNA-binding protein
MQRGKAGKLSKNRVGAKSIRRYGDSMNMQPVPLSQASLDYERIAKAISYLQTNYLEQPGLETIARAVHMSEFHFQRVFSRWAGISPKRFLQFLTVEHAKRQSIRDYQALGDCMTSSFRPRQ